MKSMVLYDIVIDILVFLETSSEEDVNPDIAIAFMEAIVSDLRDSEGTVTEQFRQRWQERIESCTDLKRRRVLEQTLEGIGI